MTRKLTGQSYDLVKGRMKIARLAANITQLQLAELTNIGYDHLRRIEYSNSHASVDSLVRIAIALNCSIDYLVGLSDNPEIIDKKLQ